MSYKRLFFVILCFIPEVVLADYCKEFATEAAQLEESYMYSLTPYERQDGPCLSKNGYAAGRGEDYGDEGIMWQKYYDECQAIGESAAKYRFQQLVAFEYQCRGSFNKDTLHKVEDKVKQKAPEFIIKHLDLIPNHRSLLPECQVYATPLDLDNKSETQEWSVAIDNTCYQGLTIVRDPPTDVVPYESYFKSPPKTARWVLQQGVDGKITSLLASWGRRFEIRLERSSGYHKLRTFGFLGGLEVYREWEYVWRMSAYQVVQESVITAYDGVIYK